MPGNPVRYPLGRLKVKNTVENRKQAEFYREQMKEDMELRREMAREKGE